VFVNDAAMAQEPSSQPSLICSTLPEDAPLSPVLREDGPPGLVHVDAAVLDRLWAMLRPSDDIRQTLTGAANGQCPAM
jgi:hypothetical protein